MEVSEGLREKLDELKRLNRNRFDYVLARSSCRSISQALKETGLTEGWYYRFSEDERNALEHLADELHYEKAIQAQLIIEQAAPEAARVKVEGLSDRDGRIRQAAATEILDRTVGKAEDKLNVTGKVTVLWNPHRPA